LRTNSHALLLTIAENATQFFLCYRPSSIVIFFLARRTLWLEGENMRNELLAMRREWESIRRNPASTLSLSTAACEAKQGSFSASRLEEFTFLVRNGIRIMRTGRAISGKKASRRRLSKLRPRRMSIFSPDICIRRA